MSTPDMPKIPSKASIKSKVRKASIEAHKRGAHIEKPKGECLLCAAQRRNQ